MKSYVNDQFDTDAIEKMRIHESAALNVYANGSLWMTYIVTRVVGGHIYHEVGTGHSSSVFVPEQK